MTKTCFFFLMVIILNIIISPSIASVAEKEAPCTVKQLHPPLSEYDQTRILALASRCEGQMFLDDPVYDGRCFVCEAPNGTFLSILTFSVQEKDSKKIGKVKFVGTDKTYLRNGIALKLIEEYDKTVSKEGVVKTEMQTLNTLSDAMAKKASYKELAEGKWEKEY